MNDSVTLVWLTGLNCDGCSIKALGDASEGGLEALLTGSLSGVQPVRLVHPILSPESGARFVDLLERAARGELEPYGIVNEASPSTRDAAEPGFYSALGESGGEPMRYEEWLARLAPRAAFVIAWGDCAVWGGPHSLAPNPIGATGTTMALGVDYRSTLGLPVINLPGCAPPHVLLATLRTILRWHAGTGPALELDAVNRPVGQYPVAWDGALGTWRL